MRHRPEILAHRGQWRSVTGRRLSLRDTNLVTPNDVGLLAAKYNVTDEFVHAVANDVGCSQEVAAAARDIVLAGIRRFHTIPADTTFPVPNITDEVEDMMAEIPAVRERTLMDCYRAVFSDYTAADPMVDRYGRYDSLRDLHEEVRFHVERDTLRPRRAVHAIAGFLQELLDSAPPPSWQQPSVGTDSDGRSDTDLNFERFEGDGDGDYEWPAAQIVRPELHVPRATRRDIRATDRGDVLRRPHRLTVDGAVFGRRRPSDRGTVVMDVSGSMSLTPDDVEKVANLLPSGRMAIYSGSIRDDGAPVGDIIVIADGGRTCVNPMSHNRYGGNVIDGTAYKWMLQQPGPYYWISDHGYGGGGATSNAVAELRRQVETHPDITVFRNVGEAITYIENGKRRANQHC